MTDYIEREAAIKLIAEDKVEITPLLCAITKAYTAEQAFDGLNQSCDRHIKFINSIPSADVQPVKWIPVTERLPEENGSYLVYVYGEVTEMNRWHGIWHRLGDNYTKAVTHWMPLPEPPKGE